MGLCWYSRYSLWMRDLRSDHATPVCWDAHFLKMNAAWKIWRLLMRRLSTVQRAWTNIIWLSSGMMDTKEEVRSSFCCADIELLCISFRPFYLPREFSQVCVFLVYIPPDAKIEQAINILQENVQQMENQSPNSPKIILGDFNQCQLEESMPPSHRVRLVIPKVRYSEHANFLYLEVR